MLGNVERSQGEKAAAICQHQGNVLLLQGEFDVEFFPREFPWCLRSVKLCSSTFEALNTLQKSDILKYWYTNIFYILVKKPTVWQLMVQGQAQNKKLPGLLAGLCLTLWSFLVLPGTKGGFLGYSRVTAVTPTISSCNLD